MLVERDQQLETLLSAAERGGRVVLVTGEAGAGKTSLLTAFREQLDHRHRFRMGRCDPLSTPVPFAPLYEMLPTLPAALREELGSGGQRERVFRELFGELASEPNVLVIDDAHWADQATVDLLRFLGRRISDTPALLVCSYRTGEVDRSHPLRVFLGELGVQAHRVDLPPLTFPAVAALSRRRGLDARRIYALTGGNPFLVTELLNDREGELPASIADAVAARAATLPDSAWQVLDAIALSPEGLELDLLEQLQRGAVQDTDRAVAVGLLRVDGVRVRARHELVRLALEANVPPVRRVGMHRLLLQLLEARTPGPAEAAVLAYHAIEGGDSHQAVHYSLQAAQRAREAGAHREARAHLANTLRFKAVMEPATLAATLEAASYESYLTGEIDQAQQLAGELAELTSDPVARGRALRWMSRLAWFQGRRQQASDYGTRAVGLLEGSDDAHELAFAYSNLAQLAMLAGDLAQAERWGAAALELASPRNDTEVIVHALNNMGAGRYDDVGEQRLEESLALSLEGQLGEHAARAFTNLGFAHAWRHQLAAAEEVLSRGMEYTEAGDVDTWWWYMRGTRSRLRLLAGDWEGAAGDAAAILAAQSLPLMRHEALVTQARLALRRGLPDAAEAVREAVETGLEIGEHIREVLAAAVAAEAAWTVGEIPGEWERLIERKLAAEQTSEPWSAAMIAFWQLRRQLPVPDVAYPEPIALDRAGDHAAAALAWESLGCRFETALLRGWSGDDEALRRGVEALRGLGADATLQALRRDLQHRGWSGCRGGLREPPAPTPRASPPGSWRCCRRWRREHPTPRSQSGSSSPPRPPSITCRRCSPSWGPAPVPRRWR